MSRLRIPCLCLVTDRRRLSPDARTTRAEIDALERWLDDAIGRVDLIQIREREVEARTLCEMASRLAVRARERGTAVMINDRADIARAAGADGVHLGGDGPPTARVRAIAAAGWLIGRSVHSTDEARAARAEDYLIFGTVFSTDSKPVGALLQGVDRLSAAVEATAVPLLAIGGIDADRAHACRRAVLAPGTGQERLGD